MIKSLPVLFVACGLQFVTNAQDNSPYSRYGLGDIVPNHNILSRAMGGIAAAAGTDYQNVNGTYYPNFNQSINFTNPASLGNIFNTIFDIGAEADVRDLKSISPAKKFSSTNSLFSYLQLAFPVTPKRLLKNKVNWGMSIGLRPYSRIDYKIEKNERLRGIDSLNTLYQGTGGINQAFIGSGMSVNLSEDDKRVKRFSAGLHIGYLFGSKSYSTKLTFLNDSVQYYRSNSANDTHIGGVFLSGGLQYETSFKSGILRLGLYGNLQQEVNATQDIVRETISYDAAGNTYRVDSVFEQKNVKGTVIFPSTIGLGFTYQEKHWLFGMDFETTNWFNYKFFSVSEQLQNSWVVRAGGQYFPATEKTVAKKYWNFVRYRAGAYYGPDYVNLGSNRAEYGFSFGTGMPLTSLQRINYGEYVVLNTAVEIGSRGDKHTNLRENTMRFSVGISMNARWFQKRKYD